MLARISAVRRLPGSAASFRRHSSSRIEGSVASSKEFSQKEQAHENEYARRHEAEQIRKLKEQIEAKKAELAKLEQEHDEVASAKK